MQFILMTRGRAAAVLLILFGIAALFVPLPSAASFFDFQPGPTLELSGSEPRNLLFGDVNGDGNADLAAVLSAEGTGGVDIRLGDGKGGLLDDGHIATGYSAWGLCAADFNGDGHLDLAVTDGASGSADVHIYRGNGQGGFTEQTVLSAGLFPIAAGCDDLNGDGWADLAVVHNDAAEGPRVFLGTGEGFADAVEIPVAGPFAATGLVLADIDGDDRKDMVVSHYDGIHLFFYGDGGQPPYGNGGMIVSGLIGAVAAGDVDGDGASDLAYAESHNGRVGVMLSTGDGGFAATGLHEVKPSLTGIIAMDLDGDGVTDVAASDRDSDSVGVLFGTGGGAFSAPRFFSAGTQPAALAAGDWNGDGLADLAVAFRNRGDTPGVSLLLGRRSAAIRGDVDRNRTVDLADSVLALKMLAGVDGIPAPDREAALDGGTIGMAEVVYALRQSALGPD